MTESQAPDQETPAPAVLHPATRREIWANRLRHFLLGVAVVCTAAIGYLVLTRGVSSPAERTSVATVTPSETPTVTNTPTVTPTPLPPTETPTPGPSPTPLPPIRYRVQAGDTWLGLAIRYDISLDSLLATNGRYDSDYIQQGEEVIIPWPTYTPTPAATQLPTLAVIEEVDPTQCREHVIATGETLLAIALKYEVSVQLLQSVNSITDPDLVRQGQKLCIPLVTPGPAPSPTFGPSPTPADRPLYPSPDLLYPPAGVEAPPGSRQVTLRWTVVGFLEPDEYYMVEIRNLSWPEARAVRGFVKTTTWRVPESVRPTPGTIDALAWRVGVVRGEGELDSSSFRWERSGLPSGWQEFLWMGIAPEPSPTPTPAG